jgi:hypothetical protein
MKWSFRCPVWCVLCCLIVLWLSGCEKNTTHVPISGKVALRNKPIEKGVISFNPEDGRTNATVADIQEGRYSVRLLPGPKRVQISAVKKVGERQAMVAGQSRTVDVTQETLPVQYNAESTLRIDVSADTNKDFDFTLQ